MFGRLASVRLKAAEEALAKGLLDEAFDIACSPDVADHRTGRTLLAELGEKLLRRGQEHLLAYRFDAADRDFERAGRCGGASEKVAEWKVRGADARRHYEAQRKIQDAAMQDAHRHLAAGSIAGAVEARQQAPMENTVAGALSAAIRGQVERAQASLDAAREAAGEGNLAVAVRHLRKARSLHNKLEGLAEMESLLVEKALQGAAEDFRAGKLVRARQQVGMLEDLGGARRERVELEEALGLAEAAAQALADDHYTKAGVLLGRLTQTGLEAEWIRDVRERLAALDQHRRALLEGPLGLAAGREVPSAVKTMPGDTRETLSIRPGPAWAGPPPIPRDDAAGAGILPKRILLRIDGVGSFLLIRGDRIGIGRAGSHSADLELLSDLSERHAEIIRAGEDYFVVSKQGVELAGRPVDHALLQDGDRIRLGSRTKLTFRRPSQKSATAMIDLGEGVRAASGDCRRVILWGGPILMGGTKECHIVLNSGGGGYVLTERMGQLFAKPMGPAGESIVLPLGVVTALGELRLSVSGFAGGSGVGRVIG